MAMVGLFWIAEGDVYVGAKPSGLAPGVRLTPEGVVGLGDRQSGLHLWEDVTALTVADVPVKSLKRRVGVVKDLALSAVTELALPVSSGRLDDAPPLMTVHVESAGGDHELAAYVAAAVGYPQTEVDLSLTLLSRLTQGAATMETTLAAMSAWGRAWEGGSPRSGEREALLREWGAGGAVAGVGGLGSPTLTARSHGRPAAAPSSASGLLIPLLRSDVPDTVLAQLDRTAR